MLFRDVIVNSADTLKSYLSHSYCDELKEDNRYFPSTIQPDNPEAGNWINYCVKNLPIDQISKMMLLLKYISLIGRASNPEKTFIDCDNL